MVKSLNDNEIVSFETPMTHINDNDIETSKYRRSKQVEYIADKLVDIYGNVGYREFYCKVAWKLSEARIWQNVEQAKNGRQKAKLFTYLCKRDGV